MTEWIFPIFFIGSVLVLISIFSSALARRFGAPLLLVFLVVGLLAGEDGFGIDFDDVSSAYLIGSLALAVILFDSGFETRLRSFRQAAAPAIVLATFGVALSAGLVGVFAHYIFKMPWLDAFLIGAIVGSTDAAAVFFLLRVGGVNIREKVRATLEVESGSNDPMAIFLTITLVELIAAGETGADVWQQLAIGFAAQMGIGVIMGLGGGYLITGIANRITVEGALYPIGLITAAICLFGVTGMAGGSGFLAVYVAGLVAGNSQITGRNGVRRFMEGTTWLSQIAMFLTLGLLATPSAFIGVAVPAIGIGLALVFVCRPIAVWLCLIPFSYQRNEAAFISWVGLRGAVSILLGIIPLAAGLENGSIIFNTTYIIVLTSLLIQGWTIKPVAKLLRLVVPAKIGPVERVGLDLPGHADHDLIVYRVVEGSPVLSGERLPRWARPSLVVREGRSMRLQFAGRLRENDLLYMFVAPRYVKLLDRLFASPLEVANDDSEFFGSFSVPASRRFDDLVRAYGLKIPQTNRSFDTIGEFMLSRLGGNAELGDRVSCGDVDLVVRDLTDDGDIKLVGLVLDQNEGRTRIPLFLNGREMLQWLKNRLRPRSRPK